MSADDSRGESERHLAHLEPTAERGHLAAALGFIRAEATRLGLGATEIGWRLCLARERWDEALLKPKAPSWL
jgi:hypothetical protein